MAEWLFHAFTCGDGIGAGDDESRVAHGAAINGERLPLVGSDAGEFAFLAKLCPGIERGTGGGDGGGVRGEQGVGAACGGF